MGEGCPATGVGGSGGDPLVHGSVLIERHYYPALPIVLTCCYPVHGGEGSAWSYGGTPASCGACCGESTCKQNKSLIFYTIPSTDVLHEAVVTKSLKAKFIIIQKSCNLLLIIFGRL